MGRELPAIFLFSGQGSQYYQMGRELYAAEPVFRAMLDHLDDVVIRELRASVIAKMYEPQRRKHEPFADIVFTHPAIVMIELALAELLIADGVRPHAVLGASLGELAAATVAGVMSPGDCMTLAARQARALEQHCRPGGMLAVLAPVAIHREIPLLRDRTTIAGENYHGHFVVTGATGVLAEAEEALRARDIAFQRVPVSFAFHSADMDDAEGAALAMFRGIALHRPRIPFYSCAAGGRVDEVTPAHFWRVAREPIAFARTIAALEAAGAHHYLDLGPSGTLHNFTRNNLAPESRSRSQPVLSPFASDADLLRAVRETFASRRTPPWEETMKVHGFPGQGAQTRGMGAALFREFPAETAKADAILGYSIERLCVDDPDGRLRLTQYTQPALFVVEALTWLQRRRDDAEPPSYLIGHSLGEYAALFAAGVFGFETGLRLVRKRGELMSRATGGGMLAVLGCDAATLEQVLAGESLQSLDIANHNAPDQLVLAGPAGDLDRAAAALARHGLQVVRLNVSAPFHSRYMQDAADEFAHLLSEVAFAPPRIPVIANVDARPYRADRVRETLARQIASPVRWVDSIRYLMGRGDFTFDELGPGQTLTRLVRKIRESAVPLEV